MDFLLERANIFYWPTQLPIRIIENGAIKNSMPQKIETAEELIHGSNSPMTFPCYTQEYRMPQFLSSNFGERYLVLVVDEMVTVIVGPFLTEDMNSAHLVKIMKENHVPVNMKAKLEAYYSHLKKISLETYYYCGKLLSVLFGSKNTKSTFTEIQPIRTSLIQEYFQSTCKNREKMFTHPPYFLEKKLISQIKLGNEKEIIATLEEINSLNRTNLAKDSMRSLKDSIICSCTLFTRAAIDVGVFPDIAFTYSDIFIRKIETMNNMSAIQNFELKMAKQFVTLIRQNISAKYSHPVFDAMQYINNNLTQDLSLANIAKHCCPSKLPKRSL